jgi:hypothetical protein
LYQEGSCYRGSPGLSNDENNKQENLSAVHHKNEEKDEKDENEKKDEN